MEIRLNTIRLLSSAPEASDLTGRWQAGQIVKAVAATDTDPRGALAIQIGGVRFQAVSRVSIAAGEPLTLLVKRLGDPPLLQLITPEERKHEIVTDHLRRALPRQASLIPFLRAVVEHRGNPFLPQTVSAVLERIIAGYLPDPVSPDSRALRAAIGNSGVFLERKLAAVTNTTAFMGETLTGDFKAQLLQFKAEIDAARSAYRLGTSGDAADRIGRTLSTMPITQMLKLVERGEWTLSQLAGALLQRLTPAQLADLSARLAGSVASSSTPEVKVLVQALQSRPDAARTAAALLVLLGRLSLIDELSHLADTALSHLLSRQLMPLTRDPAAPPAFLLDLPVRADGRTELLELRIEQDEASGSSKRNTWNVVVNFKASELGPLQVQVRMSDDNVAADFTAERGNTARLVEAHLNDLKAALQHAGLRVGRLAVGKGVPAPLFQSKSGRPLLDELI